ncbi:hypothetical protein HYC85_029665 [Camellia sinensis]|uniref:Reverse transcriptase domain-containing protein n=1 Tax=Camellia sinensis TaxID=4442 RepID=A0A7J7G2H5_CAMSI|nr:hypothetical protein HYC85_029665 [Camellia sinensis]
MLKERNMDVVVFQETKKSRISDIEVRTVWAREKMEFMAVDAEIGEVVVVDPSHVKAKASRPQLGGSFKSVEGTMEYDFLEKEFTEDEIKTVVKECDGNKAPGPDGFNIIKSLPFTYLGLPLGANLRRKATWKPVLDKVGDNRRTNFWTDIWCQAASLKDLFLGLYRLCAFDWFLSNLGANASISLCFLCGANLVGIVEASYDAFCISLPC